MSRSTKLALASTSVLLFAALFIPLTRIGQSVEASAANEPGTSSVQNAQIVLNKIAPWVLEKTAEGKTSEFLIVMNEQADLSGAALFASRAEKGRYVYETLYQKALHTQQPLLDWLRANGIEHRSYYVVNLIWVKGDRNVVLALAGRSEVSRVEGNPLVKGVPDEPATPAAKRQNHQEAVELGVNYIRAPEVWAAGFTGQNMVIGAADTGYRWDHTAIKNQYRGWNGVVADHNYNWHDSIHSGGGSCGPNSAVPCDDDGHGTHTAGTAVGDDGVGNQIGVAPGARWIGCRNMNQGVGTPATYLECFEFFLAPYPVGGTPAQGDPTKAPDLTTHSWTCPPSEGCSANTLQAGVEAQRSAGIITVVAAGNSGSSCSTVSDPPSVYDASYTVGAFDHLTGNIASFSSRGPVTIDGSNRTKPDITAPGVNIRSSTRTSTVSYGNLSGTSMATPHVAGAMALLLSALPSLRDQVTDAEGYLNDTAVSVATDLCSSTGIPNNVYGFGRLDVKAAVDLARTTISPASQNFTALSGSGSINVVAPTATVNWTATSPDNWITNISPVSGTGSGLVTFQVASNPGPGPRTGTIIVARKTFVVFQSASPTGVLGGILQFERPTFNANKTDGSVTITVRRDLALTAEPVTVDYFSADGTASERSDYIAASGTLQFNFGESNKTFKVLINNNGYVTGPRTVNLILENASGDATLGSTRTAVLQINDTNTVEPSINPSDDAQFFVLQQYYDFLAREPDAGGLAYWSNEISRCGSDRACINARRRDVSAAFLIENEFQQTGFFVYRIFKASFARQPGYLRFSRDRNQVVGADLGASKTAFANRWVQRADFLHQYPDTMTAELYVDALNYNSGGVLTQTGRNALVQGLRSGTETRATILTKIAEHQTFRDREYNSAFVLMQYFGYLRRDIDQGGYDFWLDVLNNREPGNYRGMVCAFITSKEYQDRFGSSHSHSNAECGP